MELLWSLDVGAWSFPLMNLTPCPNYIAGEWLQPKIAGTPVYNPSTGDVIAECPA